MQANPTDSKKGQLKLLKELFPGGYKKYAERAAFERRLSERQVGFNVLRFSQVSGIDRYSKLFAFLKQHKSELTIVADVGAANRVGAAVSIDIKKSVNPQTKVYAVDLMPVNLEIHAELNPARHEVISMVHTITKEPLPFSCDAVFFSKVDMYMTQSERRRALINIWKSLRVGGYLLGSAKKDFVLRKTARGFEKVL